MSFATPAAAVQPRLFGRTPKADLESPPDADFIQIRDLTVRYGNKTALDGVTLDIPKHRITALIGPSGSGKSTLLRALNRMNEVLPGCRQSGHVLVAGRNIYARGTRLMNLRRCVGMVFQKPNPFPRSIYENIAYVVRLGGENRRAVLDETVERSLRQAALWDEVRDRLDQAAFSLSGGQMQRLCIARALACGPQILLMDEPCSSLDPAAAARIGELMNELKREFTVVLATHDLGQAARHADHIAFFDLGKLVECGSIGQFFARPAQRQTIDYLAGRFG